MEDCRVVQIRNVNFDVWQEIRVEAMRRRVSMATLLEAMWKAYARAGSGEPGATTADARG